MNFDYRLVQFLPQPGEGSAFTVGAVVTCEGRNRFVEAPYRLTQECVGSSDLYALFLHFLEHVHSRIDGDLSVSRFGAFVDFGELRHARVVGVDPETWLVKHVLRAASPEQPEKSKKFLAKREAWNFFGNFAVRDVIKRSFVAKGPNRVAVAGVEKITYYAESDRSLLLVEPWWPRPGRYGSKSTRRQLATRLVANQSLAQSFGDFETVDAVLLQLHATPADQLSHPILSPEVYDADDLHVPYAAESSVGYVTGSVDEPVVRAVRVDLPDERDAFVEQLRSFREDPFSGPRLSSN